MKISEVWYISGAFSVTLKRTLNLPLITSPKRYFLPPENQQKSSNSIGNQSFF